MYRRRCSGQIRPKFNFLAHVQIIKQGDRNIVLLVDAVLQQRKGSSSELMGHLLTIQRKTVKRLQHICHWGGNDHTAKHSTYI